MSPGRTRAALALSALLAVYLVQIGSFPLADPDEGRYAEIPREMLASGDWVTPHLNGVVYFEKPPLLYWLTALSFRVFGPGEAAARAVPALSGVASVLLVFALGRWLLSERAAWLGAAALATSPLFFVTSQLLLTDALLTACMTATLVCVYAAHRAERKRGWVVATAACAACGVLAKGVVALLLPGVAALAFLSLRRDGRTLRALLRPEGLLAFAAVAAPWFVLMARRHPDFLRFFFLQEHVERFTGGLLHAESVLYYVPVLLGGPLPWTALAAGLALSRVGRRAFGEIPAEARLFLGLWAGVILVFFSFSGAKLATYVVPALPPLALLLGGWLDRVAARGDLSARATRAGAIAFALCGAAALAVGGAAVRLRGALAPRVGGEEPELLAVGVAALVAGGALLTAGAVVLSARLRRGAAVTVLVAGLCGALLGGSEGRRVVRSCDVLASAWSEFARPGDRLAAYRMLMQGLAFYGRTRVIQVLSYNEIRHGAERAPDRSDWFWDDPARLSREWSRGARRGGPYLFVAAQEKHLPELRAALDPEPRVVARDKRLVLVTNAPDTGVGAGPARAAQP